MDPLNFTLENPLKGVSLLTHGMDGHPLTSIGFWLRAGSRHEERPEAGITHLVEHMVFKGTSKRSARRISEDIESRGGDLNAFTAREYTCFHSTILTPHIGKAVEVIADMLQDPVFAPAALEKEKRVVVSEINMDHDNPTEYIHDLVPRALWGDHPLARPETGTVRSVRAITREMVKGYFREHHADAPLVVTACGGAGRDDIVQALDRWVKPRGGRSAECGVAGPPPLRPHDMHIRRRSEQVQLALSVPGIRSGDGKRYALAILDTLLGGGASSRLYQSIREEGGLSYSLYTHAHSFSDAGLFAAYAGTAPGKVGKVLTIMARELDSIAAREPPDGEVAGAVNLLTGEVARSIEGVEGRMEHAGESFMTRGRVTPFSGIVRALRSVRPADVSALAGRLFGADKRAVVKIGPGRGAGGTPEGW